MYLLDTEPFKFKTKPRKHQYEAFDKAWKNSHFALYMEQGTGKTKLTIDLISNYYLQKPEGFEIDAVLLIAPNGVHEQWFDEQLPDHSPIPYRAYVWEGRPASEKRLNELRHFVGAESKYIKWFLVNTEAFSTDGNMDIFKAYLKRNKVAIVVDEATSIKNTEARCTQNIAVNLNEVATDEAKRIIGITLKSKIRYILTGTMVTNNPFDQYSYGEFLYPGFWGVNEYAFKQHYGLMKQLRIWKGSYVQRIVKPMSREDIVKIRKALEDGFRVEDISKTMDAPISAVTYLKANPECKVPYKNLAELKTKIWPVSFTVTKDECYDLPDKQKLIRLVEFSKPQRKIYEELIHDLYAEYDDKELEVTTKLALLTRLTQVTGGFFPTLDDEEAAVPILPNPKIQALEKELEELEERPVIICARYTRELQLIAKTFSAEILYGKNTPEERRDLISRFKNGEVPILAVQPKVGAKGYNFQISCNMLFYSNGYEMDIREQVEDRIHRDGQTSDHVVYKDFLIRNSIDMRVYEILKEKKELLDYMRERSIREFLGGDDE